MSSDGVNSGRRKFLTAATSVVGAAGAVGIAVPFLGSWNPSAKAKAAGAPVKADVSKIEPGQTLAAQFQTPELFVIAPDIRREIHVFASVDEADGVAQTRVSATYGIGALPPYLLEIMGDKAASVWVENVLEATQLL